MKPRNIFEKPWMSSVCETERTDRPAIMVLCDSAAMFNVVVELSDNEVSRFREYEHAQDDLARTIQYRPQSNSGPMVKQSGNEPLEFIEDL